MSTELITKPQSITAFQITEINETELEKLNAFIKASSHPGTPCYIWDSNSFGIEAGRGTELLTIGEWLLNDKSSILFRSDAFVKENYKVGATKEQPKVEPIKPVVAPVAPTPEPVKVETPVVEPVVKEVVAPAPAVEPVVAKETPTAVVTPTPETKSSL